MKIKTSAFFLFNLFILFALCTVPGFSSDNTDPLLTHLDSLDDLINPQLEWHLTSVENQKPDSYRLGRSIEWRTFELTSTINAQSTSCGIEVTNTPMILKLALYSKGISNVTIMESGSSISEFTIDGSSGTGVEIVKEIVISSAVSNKTYNISIRVENKGFKPFRSNYWPPRDNDPKEDYISFSLRSADVLYSAAASNYAQLNQWLLSMRIGHAILFPQFKRYTFTHKPFPIEDRRRTPRQKLDKAKIAIDKAIMAITPELLQSNQPENVIKTIEKSYKISRPVQRLAKNFKVHLIGNAHIDIAWLWRMRETVLVARNTFDTVMNNMEEYPELHFAQSQALAYQWMEDKYPEVFKRIKEKIKEGKWEVVGGMWVEPDCNLISGESWVRQLLYGKRYFKEKFGIDVETGWNPDSFGYNWNMPQIYTKSGIKRFITQKIWWNDTTVFPHYIFRWQGVDGTQLMTYFPPVGYTSRVRMPRDMVNIINYECTTGYQKTLVLYGIGDHGGGPNRKILNRVRSYKDLHINPEFIHSKSIDFLKNLETELAGHIPVYKDELYLEYHRGTYTTQSDTKKYNRTCEALLSSAEKLGSIASLADPSVPYPAQVLERSWKTVLTNQFHDILPGSSITPVYRDAVENYKKVVRDTAAQMTDSLQALTGRIDLKNVSGSPLVVFNPLSWPRTGVATVSLSLEPDQTVQLTEPDGSIVPLTIKTDKDSLESELFFLARDIPAVGYRVYSLTTKKIDKMDAEDAKDANYPAANKERSMQQKQQPGDTLQLESPFHKITISRSSGNILSLIDKRLNHEFVAPDQEANLLRVYEDLPEHWDAWNIGYTGRKWDLNTAQSVELIEDNDVRKVVKTKKNFLGLSKHRYSPTEEFPSSFFTQYIILYNHLDRIDIRMEADWWEDHMMLKAVFPVNIKSDEAAYEIPFSYIKRTTKFETLKEKARFEVSALRWADLSQDNAGISLLNNGKYGYDIHGNIIQLSLLRSPTWPDPVADRGKHSFTYSLYTHKGDVTQGDTIKRARELNTPFFAGIASAGIGGDLPREQGFFNVISDSVILDGIKKAEDGNGYILRLYESKGKESPVEIQCIKPPVSATETNLMEIPAKTIVPKGKRIVLKLKKFEIKTIKLTF